MRSRPFKYVLLSVFISLAAGHVPLSAQPLNKVDTARELVIYLTFDDGPMESSHFIDSLVTKDSVPVEVFLTGFRVKDNVNMTAQLNSYRRQTLIEMANHSFSHANGHYKMYYADPSKVVTDILMNEDSLQLISRIVRLPGRNTWRAGGKSRTDLADANPAADSLAVLGYYVFGWDAEWRYDTCTQNYYSAEQMLKQIRQLHQSKKSFAPDHLVILCHDWMLPDTFFRKQLSLFIAAAKKEINAGFAHLSAYPYLPGNCTPTENTALIK